MTRGRNILCGSVLFMLGGVVSMPAESATPSPATMQSATTQSAAEAQMPAAVTQALQLSNGAERKKALTAAAQEWARQDPTAALAWAIHLPREDGSVSQSVFEVCARTNGKIAADWIVKQNSTAALGRFHGVMYFWAMTDHKAAAAWCMTAPKNVRQLAFFSVGDGWLVKDSAGASAWAMSLTAKDDRLAAIQGVALKWARKSIPEVTVWIKTMKPAEMTFAAKVIVEDRYNKFSKGRVKDEAAVNKWVADLPLGDADKEDVLKGPAIPGPTAKPAAAAK